MQFRFHIIAYPYPINFFFPKTKLNHIVTVTYFFFYRNKAKFEHVSIWNPYQALSKISNSAEYTLWDYARYLQNRKRLKCEVIPRSCKLHVWNNQKVLRSVYTVTLADTTSAHREQPCFNFQAIKQNKNAVDRKQLIIW